MQAVCPDEKVEPAPAAVLQLDFDVIRFLFDENDLVSENGFNAADLFEQHAREVAALKSNVLSIRQLGEDVCTEADKSMASFIYDPKFLGVVAVAIDLRDQSHPFGDGVAEPPEINDIASAP